MSTFRQIASNIINDFRANNLDDRISYRFIIRKLISAASYYFRQDAKSRELFKINVLWQSLKCIEMETVNLVDCNFDISGCATIQKSKKQIPQTYQTSYGNVIKIINTKYSKEYKEIKPEQYRNYKNRRFVLPQFGYFWIIDNYLYLPDTEVQTVGGLGIFKSSIEVDKFNDIPGSECLSPLDSVFLFPDYVIYLAKQDIIKSIGTFTKRIIVDEDPNLNSNRK